MKPAYDLYVKRIGVMLTSKYKFIPLVLCFVLISGFTQSEESNKSRDSYDALAGVKEIVLMAHTYLDEDNIQENALFYKKHNYLRNDFFESSLEMIVASALSEDSKNHYILSKVKGRRSPRYEIFRSDQIIVEITYGYQKKDIEGRDYIVGGVYANIWRSPDVSASNKHISGFHPYLTAVQPVGVFILSENENGAEEKIRLAIHQSVEKIIDWINDSPQFSKLQ